MMIRPTRGQNLENPIWIAIFGILLFTKYPKFGNLANECSSRLPKFSKFWVFGKRLEMLLLTKLTNQTAQLKKKLDVISYFINQYFLFSLANQIS